MWGCEIGEENFSERLFLLFLGIGSDLNEDLELWVLIFLKWGGQKRKKKSKKRQLEVLVSGNPKKKQKQT